MFEDSNRIAQASDFYRECIDNWLDDLENILEVADVFGRDALMVWEEEARTADEIDRYCGALVEC